MAKKKEQIKNLVIELNKQLTKDKSNLININTDIGESLDALKELLYMFEGGEEVAVSDTLETLTEILDVLKTSQIVLVNIINPMNNTKALIDDLDLKSGVLVCETCKGATDNLNRVVCSCGGLYV